MKNEVSAEIELRRDENYIPRFSTRLLRNSDHLELNSFSCDLTSMLQKEKFK